nr:ribosome maturation protein SBDS-like [Ipomoea batatas]GMD00200.1 ribosome maturation protein SBDS-like [Ipomoea batatas]GMD84437.1 ribosome maturation protein SBDS-like [Ipomoea batatas]
MASRLATTMCNSLKGRPILGRIFQGWVKLRLQELHF